MTEPTTLDRLLDAAEGRIRRNGFNGFSFRDLAGDVGIRSASVHHYFPTKADLGVAVAERYTERIMALLGDPRDPARAPADLLAALIAAHRRTLVEGGMLCLASVLGAESADLPDIVCAQTRRFVGLMLDWIAAVIRRQGVADAAAQADAARLLARIHGAMLLAHTMQRPDLFDMVIGDTN